MPPVDAHDLAMTAAATAIHAGDLPALQQLLTEHPGLAATRLADDCRAGAWRTLLHVATDWPGHFPRVAETIRLLVAAGADVNARFAGPHEETPLHWAASSDDVAALDALLDAGADIDAPGAVLGGGGPLADATGFAQWAAARRLVERGASTRLADEAALGLIDRLERRVAPGETPPTRDEVSRGFWGACHGGQLAAAEWLLARGADIDWLPGWERLTPLDAAARSGAKALAAWLKARGAHSAVEL